jgi:hypothetical protein
VLAGQSVAILLTEPDDTSLVPALCWQRGRALLLAPFGPAPVPYGSDGPAAPRRSAAEVVMLAREAAPAEGAAMSIGLLCALSRAVSFFVSAQGMRPRTQAPPATADTLSDAQNSAASAA